MTIVNELLGMTLKQFIDTQIVAKMPVVKAHFKIGGKIYRVTVEEFDEENLPK